MKKPVAFCALACYYINIRQSKTKGKKGRIGLEVIEEERDGEIVSAEQVAAEYAERHGVSVRSTELAGTQAERVFEFEGERENLYGVLSEWAGGAPEEPLEEYEMPDAE